jgi:hypothetical protein
VRPLLGAVCARPEFPTSSQANTMREITSSGTVKLNSLSPVQDCHVQVNKGEYRKKFRHVGSSTCRFEEPMGETKCQREPSVLSRSDSLYGNDYQAQLAFMLSRSDTSMGSHHCLDGETVVGLRKVQGRLSPDVIAESLLSRPSEANVQLSRKLGRFLSLS